MCISVNDILYHLCVLIAAALLTSNNFFSFSGKQFADEYLALWYAPSLTLNFATFWSEELIPSLP